MHKADTTEKRNEKQKKIRGKEQIIKYKENGEEI